jgi:hypothetical protein
MSNAAKINCLYVAYLSGYRDQIALEHAALNQAAEDQSIPWVDVYVAESIGVHHRLTGRPVLSPGGVAEHVASTLGYDSTKNKP